MKSAERRRLAWVATVALLSTGCGETVSPTEPAATSMQGEWSGTYRPNDPFLDCDSPSVRASFRQDKDMVSGTITARGACGFPESSFTGTLQDVAVNGTLTGPAFVESPGSVRGTVGNGYLTLQVSTYCTGLCYLTGSIDLRRRPASRAFPAR